MARAQGDPTLSSGMNAALVIGQSNFTLSLSLAGTPAPAPTQSNLNGPRDIAFDSSGDLWVVDGINNRILEFKPPFVTGMSASLVIGQTTFTTGPSVNGTCSSTAVTQASLCNPSSIAFDKSGNLWVSDTGENRILEFQAPFSNGMSASLVIGQTNFTTSSSLPGCQVSSGQTTCAGSLEGPTGLAFDSSGNLWVVDSENNRVLEYNPPFSNSMNASLAIGASSLTVTGNGPGQNQLNLPDYLAFDSSGNLWVTEFSSILEFPTPFSTGMNASIIIGQPNFTSDVSLCNTCFPLRSSLLSTAEGITFDSSGNLWVADNLNGRVLEFNPPFSTYMNASLAIGKLNLTSISNGCSVGYLACQSSLSGPWGVSFDSSGNLWVSDTGDNRILEFGPATAATSGVVTTASATPVPTIATTVVTTSSVVTSSSVIPVTSSSSSPSPTAIVTAVATTTAVASTTSSSNTLLFAAVAVVVIVIIGALGYMMRMRRKPGTPPPQTPKSPS